MRNNGYIKLDRKILKWGWYDDANTFRLFVHLLLTANYADSEYRGRIIKRGQLAVGRNQLSNQLNISVQAVRTALNHLISTNEITIETNPQGSIITIKNYDKYQKPTNKSTNNQPTTNQRPTNGATNKSTTSEEYIRNNKKEKNERKEEVRSHEQSFDDSFLDSDASDQLKAKGGSLGQGVVMLSEKQDDYLLDHLSFDEYNKYISIVAEQELKGNSYKKKTHFQAIIEMVNRDRRIAGEKCLKG